MGFFGWLSRPHRADIPRLSGRCQPCWLSLQLFLHLTRGCSPWCRRPPWVWRGLLRSSPRGPPRLLVRGPRGAWFSSPFYSLPGKLWYYSSCNTGTQGSRGFRGCNQMDGLAALRCSLSRAPKTEQEEKALALGDPHVSVCFNTMFLLFWDLPLKGTGKKSEPLSPHSGLSPSCQKQCKIKKARLAFSFLWWNAFSSPLQSHA